MLGTHPETASGKTEHHVKDSFPRRWGSCLWSRERWWCCMMLSPCPCSQGALEAVRHWLEEDDSLGERTRLSIHEAVWSIRVVPDVSVFCFHPEAGGAIGSPISPVVSDIYVENFESKAMVSFAGVIPRAWWGYMDDTFVIIKELMKVSLGTSTRLTSTCNSRRILCLTLGLSLFWIRWWVRGK